MNCLNCGKKLNKRQKKYCSYSCMNEHRKKRVLCKCKICGEDFYIKESALKKGEGKYCSMECRKNRKIFTCKNCGKRFEGNACYDRIYCSKKCLYEGRDFLKDKNPNWQGGIDKHREEINSKKYKNWRKEVFERDNYTCQICGQIGHELHSHHIKTWKNYPKQRYHIQNGLTLCRKCHNKIHGYMRSGLIRGKAEMPIPS